MALKQLNVTATRKTARLKNPEPKSTAATKPPPGWQKKKAATSVKIAALRPQRPNWWFPPKVKTPHSGNFLFLRSPSFQGCVEVTRRLLLCILSLLMGSPTAGCPEDRYSLRGKIWQHALGRRNGVKTCASPAGIRMEGAAESLNWSIFSTNNVPTFVT